MSEDQTRMYSIVFVLLSVRGEGEKTKIKNMSVRAAQSILSYIKRITNSLLTNDGASILTRNNFKFSN